MLEILYGQIGFKMNHLCRLNGPNFLTINFDKYVTEYVNRGHERCDALYPHGGPRTSSDPHGDDEELLTRAKFFSSIYNV